LDFVFLADRSAGGGAQTQNTIFNQSNPNSFQASVAEPWRDLTVDGVPAPRVPVQDMGGPVGPDNMTDIWVQLKYRSNADPIPFATGREAALMIAEVTGGQTAVDIINTLRSTYSLPQFSSTDENEIRATVIEERKRELWLQGTRIGDMLRLNLPWVTGRSPRG